MRQYRKIVLVMALIGAAVTQAVGQEEQQDVWSEYGLLNETNPDSPFALSITLQSIQSRLPEELISPEAWGRIVRLRRWVDFGTEDLQVVGRMSFDDRLGTPELVQAQQKRAEAAIRQLPEIVGPEAWQITVARVNAHVIGLGGGFSGSKSPIDLDSRVMRQIFRLTDDQVERHDENANTYLKQVSEWKKERDRELGQLADDKYHELLKVLTQEQRKTYREIYGEPIWFYKLESKRFGLSSFQTWVDPNCFCTMPPIKDFDNSSETSEEKNSEDQPPIPDEVDIVWYHLITEPPLQEEFEATEDQVKQLKALGKRIHSVATLTNRPHAQRLVQLLEGKFDDYGLLEEILLDHQMTWLRHCELQLRLVAERSSFGLLSPELAHTLHLTGSQKDEIRRIVAEYETKSDEMIAQMDEEYRRFSAEFIRENLAILNDEQKAALSRYVTPEELAKIFIESLRPPLPAYRKRAANGESRLGLSSGADLGGVSDNGQ